MLPNEGTLIQNIEKNVAEILAACKDDPAKTEIARVNFELLITVIKKFEKGPRYYNAILEDQDAAQNNQMQSSFQMPVEKKGEPDAIKYPVIAELEKIYHKKLTTKELQALGSSLSKLQGLKLNRDTKRNKIKLLKWFSTHWQIVHSKIYEFGLNDRSKWDTPKTNPENPPQ
ncbi:hypothetical protein TVAG_192460 [Trichomonas vaginalis G3]|uniref:Uncharacterized protein n=1 Tax=Trichomonas vaginalis (strain ATCC PRA-98 / G3) TaxID=412133 RepID=A2DGW0_TRIV3|nr:hypothetical protein TVAGG3_0318900 [Trichomonas vaginalis G3]EAY20270.1 hypothetical protein TVAG_192460 [Trichomonas vaginalis G3]KAI5529142.1 hypothetical protein TVAGG3_0318900 [Trichomonas vaginalis G3]|eukprot:XP_001581256.1 hypothetical protein [Trichomonas vaginalis G3]